MRFLLFFLLAAPLGALAQTPESPDIYTPPGLAPFLGASQSVFGVKLRVVDARFSDAATLFPGEDYSWMPKTGFFASLKVEAPRSTRKPSQLVRFVGASSERGEESTPSWRVPTPSVMGETRFFWGVSPTVKSLTLRYEVLDPRAPADAEGVFNTTIAWDDLEAPAPGQTVQITPPRVFTTEKGSQIKLVSLEGKKNGFYLRLQVERAPEIPREGLEFQNFSATFETGEQLVGGWIDEEENPFVEETERFWIGETYLPPGAWRGVGAGTPKKFDLRLRLQESDSSWKRAEFFKTVEFSLPVSALYARAPVAKRAFPVAPLTLQGERFEATLEPFATNASGWRGQIWVRYKKPDGSKVSIATFRYVLPGTTPDDPIPYIPSPMGKLGNDSYRGTYAFHLDNTPRRENEIVREIQLTLWDENTARPSTVDLIARVLARSVRTQVVKQISLPAPGETKSYEGLNIGDEAPPLRSIRWITNAANEPERVKNALKGSSGLLLSFDTNKWPLEKCTEITANTDVETLEPLSSEWISLNLLDTNPGNGQLLIVAPPTGAKTLDLHFKITDSLIETFEWKNVALGKLPETDFYTKFLEKENAS